MRRERVEVHVTTSGESETDLRNLLLRILIEDGVDPVSELAARGGVEISEADLEPGEVHVSLAVPAESVEEIEGVEALVQPDEDPGLERKAAKTSDLTVEDEDEGQDEKE